MTSTSKQNKSTTILLFICALLTANVLPGMQEQSPERSLTIQNDLATPISAILYYYTQKKLTKEEKYYLDAQQISEEIVLPLNKTISFIIETEHCTHKRKGPDSCIRCILSSGENKILLKDEDHINSHSPLISIRHHYGHGTDVSFYDKKTK